MKINNIHCLALNYNGVGLSDQSPIYFLKSTSCITHEGGVVPFPKHQVDSNQVWTEVELGVKISQDCSDVSEQEAINFIEGFFVAGDITCGNIYGRDHHLAFSKARNGFAPISSNVTKLDLRESTLQIATYINGKLTQLGNTSSMILNPYQSVSYLSKLVKLQKGDIILTGTPTTPNGGPQFDCLVNPGDSIRHVIVGLGDLNYTFGL
jgi:2-keto-4-pentenoate hydratase/2-oxohepta-3-ene-1,7-dioic acid hydratase in catechol pathway